MVDHDPGFEPKCCNEAPGAGAILDFQAYEVDTFCFDQFAGSSGGSLTIPAGTFEQGTSLIEMVTRHSSKDSDAISNAFGITYRRSNTSQREKASA